MKKNECINFLNEQAKFYESELINIREKLHRIPELAFQEFETTNFIERYIKSLSNFKINKPTKTGLIAEIDSGKPGKVLAIRADIDGLAVKEETNLAYKSTKEGYMHACGHDGHVASLLIAAKILNENIEIFNGKIKLLFQPAEEIGEGANVFIENGVLDDVDLLFGLHIWVSLEDGSIAVNERELMAAGDFFDIVVKGKGGHAAIPQEVIDPIIISTNIISSLQTIVSRNLPPTSTGVVSVTKIESGDSYNVIPEFVKLGGTIRSLSLTDLEIIYTKIEELCQRIAHAYGGEVEINFASRPNSFPLINDIKMSREIREALIEGIKDANCCEILPTLAGDDFSQYQKLNIPSTYIFVGSGTSQNCYPHHHPKFNITNQSLINALKSHLHVIRINNMEE